jgi:hypothetical protein
MAGDASQKDLQTLQDGLVDGLITPDNLPSNVRDKVFQYMGTQGIDMSNPQSQVTQAQLAALKQQRESQENGIFDSKIFKPVEWLGSKIYQAWSATISPAASFASLELGTFSGFLSNQFGSNPSKSYLHDHALGFGDAWNLAHHVSPAQAWWMSGMTDAQKEKYGLTQQDMLKQAKLIEEGKQVEAPNADDPFGVQSNVDKFFGNGVQKYVTGTTDFAFSWYADPLVLAGKGASVMKGAALTREVAPQIAKETEGVLKTTPGLTPEVANKMAWDNFTNKTPFQNLTNHFWNIKGQYGADQAAAVMLREPTLAKSANGPAMAKLLAQASNPTEVANVLRVGMGDTAAYEALRVQNGDLAYQIKQLNNRYSTVSTYYNGLSDAEKLSPTGLRTKALLDAQTSDLAKLDQQTRIVSDKIDAYRSLDALNFNGITTPMGLKTRQAWQQSREWKPFQDGGFIKTQMNNIYSFTVGGVVKLAHTYGDLHPTHYIDVKSPDGHLQLNASLQEVKGMTQAERDMHVSTYLNAQPELRAATLNTIEQKVTHKLVDQYNAERGLTGTPDELPYSVANSLYREIASKRMSAQASINREQFGAMRIENPDMPGTTINIDEIAPDGSTIVTTPLLRSQMANSHPMMDFKLFKQALDANGSLWGKAAKNFGTGWEKVVNVADTVNTLWKFSALFRLGYGPRAMADDFLGQVARFGPAAMLQRGVAAGKYTRETILRGSQSGGTLEAAQVARGNLELHMDDLAQQQKILQNEIDLARNEGRTADLQSLQTQLDGNVEDLKTARDTYKSMDVIVKGGPNYKNAVAQGEIFPPAFSGVQGGLFKDLASGENNFKNMMGGVADSYLNQLRRMEWTQLSAAKNPTEHMPAWLRVINQQVANDDLAKLYLRHNDKQRAINWLSSPEGLAYKRNHTIAQHLPNDQLVDRVAAQVDEWLNPNFPGGDIIRNAAIKGEVTEDMLKEVPVAVRPLVNGQALSYARGSHQAMQMMSSWMDKWYKWMGSMPNAKLLRNPLFAQRYQVHLDDAMKIAGKNGETRLTEDMRQSMVQSARRLALRDVKLNTFTMDYETKLSYMMKNFGAFFGAQQESWNRWGRIISDKPDVGVHIAQVMGAPTRAGITTDSNGQKIDPDGYVTDPVTGQRRLIPYNERHIIVQIPDYLGGKQFKKFFGLDPNATMDVPLSTANIILNHGDGPIPVSSGPYVQMAANAIADKSPKVSDTLQQLGVLPFGPTSTFDLHQFLPNWWRKKDGSDVTSDTYQAQLWYIMQAENYKYHEGLRKDPPTWNEISKRASHQSWLKTLTAAVLPISMSAKDPYQFFRDQYKAMQKAAGSDSNLADQMFYDKFGDSAFVFTQSLSKNNSGLQPTANAVKMSQYYQDLITKVGPQWAGLIVGAEGEGTYSNGAFHYEQTHATDPASGTTYRSKMSAREALDAADLAKGWQQYTAQMNDLYAELFQAGFQSFDDPGAEQLKAERKAAVDILSEPKVIDQNGNVVDNKFYNAAWSKAYNTINPKAYDQQAVQLKQIVNDPEIWSKAVGPNGTVGVRADIYGLKQYLTYRDDAKAALILRKADGGSDDINAQSNADIKSQWNAMVVDLIQRNTMFGNLFHRYLSRDMGFDQATVTNQENQGLLPDFIGDNTAQQQPGQTVFDQFSPQPQQGGLQ